ncbi:MAG: 1,4-dihydroxy-2-naphthoyl-CoA hydrolase [Porticoccus sp.]|jgi:1,4-dihydroxy-2-naphthoyl-CoA hydrolase
MTIWNMCPTVEQANEASKGTLMEHTGMVFTEIGDDYVKATMPVDHRTIQPMGLLNGGASVALAESVGSFAAQMAAAEGDYCVGLDINANHLRGVRSGLVTATASPIHVGRTTQVWGIEIVDDSGKKACVCRLTMSVVKA